ncbi:hypothetical protein PLICRDRAFT_39855 [Plicaturopsis crispa FD-325 SS-3]|nr:hypothetical protein PLICRDRAFT_39855 [Plicaturopsis crispa FD-325 SS-3]
MAGSSAQRSNSRTSVKIPSATPGWKLDTWCYLPDANARAPSAVIIMAHGFGANKLMGLSKYAEAFVDQGYAVLVFDYRRWGSSDGTPRHILSVPDQLEDYRTVIKYARQQPEIDPQRVIIWGSSFSGGHAITLASDPSLNVAAALAQCPYTGVTSRKRRPITFPFLRIMFYALADAVKLRLGLSPLYIPVAGLPGQVAALTSPGALDGLSLLAENSGDFPNKVSASSLLSFSSYKPFANASAISAPILVLASIQDNLCPASGARKVTATAQQSELVELPGGHFDVYPGGKDHDASLQAQITFLRKYGAKL